MRRAVSIAGVVGTVALLGAVSALALSPEGMGRPRFLDELFSPRLVMQHQTQIGLTGDQRDAISKVMADTQKHLLDLRWRLEDQSTALTKVLAEPKVDADAALGLSDRVMDLEREMKRAHLAMLIAIKNRLEPGQQEKLRALRGHEPPLGRADRLQRPPVRRRQRRRGAKDRGA